VHTPDARHEFVLARGQELYDHLRASQRDPLGAARGEREGEAARTCECGKKVSSLYLFCPWCGRRM